jgi:hypothetical protein
MKNMRMPIIIITPVIVFIVGFYSVLNNKYRKNVANSEKIKIGMSSEEVLEIMGPPKKVLRSYFADSDSLYFYQPPLMASNGIEIFFCRGRVNRVSNYEGT